MKFKKFVYLLDFHKDQLYKKYRDYAEHVNYSTVMVVEYGAIFPLILILISFRSKVTTSHTTPHFKCFLYTLRI